MRCHEARRRIDEIGLTDVSDADYEELLSHLQHCPGCARQAQASQELQEAMVRLKAHDTDGGLSWSQTIARVESGASLADSHQTVERPVMAIFKNQLTKRPKLSFGVCAAVAILLAVTLIPFKYNKDVGFEVAVAGVDKSVALNSEGISEMMAKLGLEDAVVDVTGCDVTCNLKITELKSPEDAKLVAAAFEEVGKNSFHVNIRLVSEEASGNLLQKMRQQELTTVMENLYNHGEDVHSILIERLGEGFENKLVFYVDSSDNFATIDIAPADSSEVFQKQLQWTQENSSEAAHGMMFVEEIGAGQFSLNGSGDLFDENGELNEEMVQRLKDEGYRVEVTENADGTRTVNLYRPDNDAGEEAGDAAKSSDKDALPEGFALSQNYPNPFNPTTRIDYSLPSAQHVTLEIYNVQGQKVRTLVNETVGAGDHSVEWDATTDAGVQVASGVYLYRLTAGDHSESKKMSFVK